MFTTPSLSKGAITKKLQYFCNNSMNKMPNNTQKLKLSIITMIIIMVITLIIAVGVTMIVHNHQPTDSIVGSNTTLLPPSE